MAFTPLARLSLVTQRSGEILGGDLAVDLGTANTLVYVRGRGILLNEPSVVAVDTTTNAVVAVGVEAKRMIGRTPGHIRAVRPLQAGVIADYDITAEMLRYFIRKVLRRPSMFTGPRVVICVPSGITNVEQRAVSETAYAAGARRVHIISEPMAAAIGAGLPVNQPAGSMVIDIGGGTTEVAVIALGGIVASTSLRVAGNALDEAIVEHIRAEFSLLIGERTAEELKISVGSAFPVAGPARAEIRGRDIASGLPRNVTVAGDELRRAMDVPISRIIGAVRATLDRCPPELAGDLVSRGVVLTGGGALLRGLAARVQHEIGIPVLVAERPLDSVVLGTGTVVEHFDALQKVVIDGPRR
ncbi:rod shape-determining protein MreB [Jatrophihabitans sp. GAS493]|uniref:rod shape-determining protein n=1 Tax=Jatrophihabitans sp. GAS493 TaxID=1907575 RepID=UPI000BC03776|nr:rod shape-determining protein MreB [Jatrophihabitans sp. GAS493]